ncbi:MAG: PLP-dependent cysteine synthase family protein [Candidatus Margulisiibacteriota bacterium]
MVTTSLLDLVGNTPLLSIPHPNSHSVPLFAKAEWMNPSGSVKDRAAKHMLLAALKAGQLEGKRLLDASSGNTGIAYATLGAALGIQVSIALPENASIERKLLLQNLGAEVILTPAMEGTDGAQRRVKTLLETHKNLYFCPDQYNNPNNWLAHFEHTGPEIWSQTQGNCTHFVAGLGTTGSFIGTSRFLKSHGVHCVAIQPDNPMHGLEGWKHLETALVPGIFDASVANETRTIGTETAFGYAKAAAKYLGLMLSPSAAANIAASLTVASELQHGCVVTLLPDNAFKYLHDAFWNDHDYTIPNPFN